MTEYKSSVLRCHVGDDNCPLCRFIEHDDRSPAVLMRVIEVLDAELSENEDFMRSAIRSLVEKVSKGN